MSTNLYQRLKSLLPDAPIQSGAVTAVYADSTAAVALDGGGGELRVRNALGHVLGEQVYVQSGAIIGTAPDLPYVLIEV